MRIWQKYFRGDAYIWFAVFLLSLLGMLAVYSSTGSLAFVRQSGNTEFYIIRHAMFLFAGLVLMYLCHLIDYRYYSRLSQLLVWLSVVLLILTLIFGDDVNDASRRLTVLGISFQPSDLAKVALVMYIARYLSKNQEELDSWKGFGKILAIICVICLLIMPENLSTSLVLFSTCCLLLFIGNARIKHLAALMGIFIVMAGTGFLVLTKTPADMLPGRAKTWKSRIETFMAPDEQESYQTQQAKIAVVTGGFVGKGPGKSTQRNYLPHPYSDFIYAVIIEEYGLAVGGLLIALIFLLILYRTIRIVVRSPKAFGALVAVGLGFSLVIQAFIHMAVAVSLFPVTGLTLPLVSMGGTSMIFTSVAFGVILSVSRTIEEEQQADAALKPEGGNLAGA